MMHMGPKIPHLPHSKNNSFLIKIINFPEMSRKVIFNACPQAQFHKNVINKS